ncbi:MAG: non-hydrolyzing UDP-N-acetylglucosamine 2-epimerase [Promethearchaeota archaeon]
MILKSDEIFFIAGARPNFMKIAPLVHQSMEQGVKFKIIHTGQHYDYNMSRVFFENLNIPEPDFYLDAGSGTHAYQTAKVMIEFEKLLLKEKPKLVVVVGDVNSTIACALVAKKLFVDVAHVEAGLRSFDRSMPEEINRVLTDQISDLLFTTEKDAKINLKNEGIEEQKIFFVGNVMIDTLITNLEKANLLDTYKNFGLLKNEYALITLHRPSNVDLKENLIKVVDTLNFLSEKIKVFFPVHPRTNKNLIEFGLYDRLKSENLIIAEPIGYLEFLNLMVNSKLILTDSGGVQEEASYLGIPLLTLRENTERPITVEYGTNTIIGRDFDALKSHINDILASRYKKGQEIEGWDGEAAKRIMEIIKRKYFD